MAKCRFDGGKLTKGRAKLARPFQIPILGKAQDWEFCHKNRRPAILLKIPYRICFNLWIRKTPFRVFPRFKNAKIGFLGCKLHCSSALRTQSADKPFGRVRPCNRFLTTKQPLQGPAPSGKLDDNQRVHRKLRHKDFDRFAILGIEARIIEWLLCKPRIFGRDKDALHFALRKS